MVRSPAGTKNCWTSCGSRRQGLCGYAWLQGAGRWLPAGGKLGATVNSGPGQGSVGAGNGCAASRAGLPVVGLGPEGRADTMPADSAYSLGGAGRGFNTKAALATDKRWMWRRWRVEKEVSCAVQRIHRTRVIGAVVADPVGEARVIGSDKLVPGMQYGCCNSSTAVGDHGSICLKAASPSTLQG